MFNTRTGEGGQILPPPLSRARNSQTLSRKRGKIQGTERFVAIKRFLSELFMKNHRESVRPPINARA